MILGEDFMHKSWWIGAFALTMTVAGAANAEETGVEIGVRSGYAIPLGEAGGGDDLSDLYGGIIPLWFDLGYRLTPNVMIGAYFQYGFGLLPSGVSSDGCEAVDCSLSNMRLGAQVHYHFLPWEKVDPWLGAGIGYEWGRQSVSGTFLGQTLDVSSTFHGFEFFNLQAGVDFLPSEETNFGLGPFIALSLAQYSDATVKADGEEGSGEIQNKGIHEWLTLGIRGTFVP
jgi:opacity protein-like surface antigen